MLYEFANENPNYKERLFSYEVTKAFISKSLIYLGLLILLVQLVPLSISVLLGIHSTLLNYSTTVEAYDNTANSPIPVDISYLQLLVKDKYYDPGPKLFEEIKQNYLNTSLPSETASNIPINESYSKMMYISIPTLEINRIPLTPNVPSAPKEVYEQALKKGVAHLKGTPLPGDGSNAVIYGHSGITRLFGRIKPYLVFSKLERINLGDSIIIYKDGQQLKYRVKSKKIVSPTNLYKLVGPTKNDQVTLVTCWPLGLGAKRLVVTAIRE